MKAKKLLSLGIAGTMAVALLAGCSSSGSSSSAASSGDTATRSEEHTLNSSH